MRCQSIVWSIGKQKQKRTCMRGARGADRSFDQSASKKQKNLCERCERCKSVVWSKKEKRTCTRGANRSMRGADWSFDRLASKKAKKPVQEVWEVPISLLINWQAKKQRKLCERCVRCKLVVWSIGKHKTKKSLHKRCERCRSVKKQKRACTRGVRGANQSFDRPASKKKSLRERCDRCQSVVWLIGKQKSKQKELLNNTQLFNKQFVLHHREPLKFVMTTNFHQYITMH